MISYLHDGLDIEIEQSREPPHPRGDEQLLVALREVKDFGADVALAMRDIITKGFTRPRQHDGAEFHVQVQGEPYFRRRGGTIQTVHDAYPETPSAYHSDAAASSSPHLVFCDDPTGGANVEEMD